MAVLGRMLGHQVLTFLCAVAESSCSSCFYYQVKLELEWARSLFRAGFPKEHLCRLNFTALKLLEKSASEAGCSLFPGESHRRNQ